MVLAGVVALGWAVHFGRVEPAASTSRSANRGGALLAAQPTSTPRDSFIPERSTPAAWAVRGGERQRSDAGPRGPVGLPAATALSCLVCMLLWVSSPRVAALRRRSYAIAAPRGPPALRLS